MLKLWQKFLLFDLYIVMVLAGAVYSASQPKGLEDIWDSDRYIGLDEIKPGM